MPASTDATAQVTRAGEALSFAGVLSRGQVAGLWRRMPPLDGVKSLDLGAVAAIDSAGLALLAEIAERTGTVPDVIVSPDAPPEGLSELQAAYRLDAGLRFQHA